MRQEKFTEQAQELLAASQELVRSYRNSRWDVEHILLAMLRQEDGLTLQIWKELRADVGNIQQRVEPILVVAPKMAHEGAQIYATLRTVNLLQSARAEADHLNDEFIGVDHILIAMAGEHQGKAANILNNVGIDQEKLYRALQVIRGSQRVTDSTPESKYRILERYGYDLTEMARQGKLEPVTGRDSEVQQLIEVLAKRTRNSPLLVGDASVDKLCVVEELARRVAAGTVPGSLQNKQIIALDLGKLVAGAKLPGEFEERVEAVVLEVIQSERKIILYFDELWVRVADGGLELGSMLKFPLSFGECQCVAATTPKYLEYFGEKGLLARQFEVISLGKAETTG